MTTSYGQEHQREVAHPQPPTAERITVALMPAAGDHLQLLANRTNMSKTDIINRAITMYEFIDAQLRAGQEVLIRDSSTGETRIVWIF